MGVVLLPDVDEVADADEVVEVDVDPEPVTAANCNTCEGGWEDVNVEMVSSAVYRMWSKRMREASGPPPFTILRT